MPSLHPRYPVLKVPAPARLSAAVAQGLIMPEDRPPGGGNLRLHILYTYLNRRDRPISQTRAEEDIKSAGKTPCCQSFKGTTANRSANSFAKDE